MLSVPSCLLTLIMLGLHCSGLWFWPFLRRTSLFFFFLLFYVINIVDVTLDAVVDTGLRSELLPDRTRRCRLQFTEATRNLVG